jgi:hypothetical protein
VQLPRTSARDRRDEDDPDVEELRAALREHAREAERQREEATSEVEALKQSLRGRLAAIAAREQELEEAARRLEHEREQLVRRRGRARDDDLPPEARLERRAEELDALASELARRERELARRERVVAALEDG